MFSSLSKLRTVIVTGSSRGIGKSIVEQLYAGQNAYNIILTSRSAENGQRAADEIKRKHPNSSNKITIGLLDIADHDSTNYFVDWVKDSYGTVDVLINNAGYGKFPEDTPEIKLTTFRTNFLGTLELTEGMLPCMSNDGKLIFISSALGGIHHQPAEGRKLLEDPALNLGKLYNFGQQYYKSLGTQSNSSEFSHSSYATSKAFLNAYAKYILPKRVQESQQVYSVLPDGVKADLWSFGLAKSPEEWADTPVYLTNLPFEVDQKTQGKFFSERRMVSDV